jgi:hypothetical protein
VSLYEICQWLQDSYYATTIRESVWVFPIVESSHVLALGLAIGTVLWFDLRLLGVGMRRHSVSETFDYIKPWMLTGFAIMMISGIILFYSHALRCYESTFFRIKVVLLFLAGGNILVYHTTVDRYRHEWDKAPIPPLQARVAGLVSIVMWTSIVVVGRLMAYTL